MNISFSAFNTMAGIQETENAIFSDIHQYAFDCWIQGANLLQLNLNLHTARILEKQETPYAHDKVDSLLAFLSIFMFPTNAANYEYNMASILNYYLFHYSYQIVKKVDAQIQSFNPENDNRMRIDGFELAFLEPLGGEEEEDDAVIDMELDASFSNFFQDWLPEVPPITLTCVEVPLSHTETCSICLSEDVKPYIQTACGHSFCDCLITHCLKKNHCPLCRQTVTDLKIHDANHYRIMRSCLKYDDRFAFV